ncbi:MAG TPA: SDR family oxidoreductase [Solirubrobacteraceae bacterium]|nr:SDR family oxidoreductase [Solirubrobacteraceae bacterium]
MTAGPRVLITGGGSGIGAACARAFAARGARVAVNGRRAAPLEEIAREIGGIAIAGDGGDPEQAEALVAAALGELGGLDCLVLNAGIGHSGTVLEQTPESWRAVMRTNVDAAFLVARAALPALIESRGSVVSVASKAAIAAGPASAAYCTSKAAMVMLTKTIAFDFAPQGVRANAVCPGWVRTPMGDEAMDELATRRGVDRERAYALANDAVPARRAAEPEEVAALVVWLASAEASYLNGAAIPLDGGAGIVDVALLAFGDGDG